MNKNLSNTLQVLLAVALFSAFGIYGYKAISEAKLRAERSANLMTQTVLKSTFLRWELSEAITPEKFNQMNQTQRRETILNQNKQQFQHQSSKENFAQVINSNPIPNFGEILQVNTEIPPAVWNTETMGTRQQASFFTITLLLITAILVCKPTFNSSMQTYF